MTDLFWDDQADSDPLFAILSDARKAGRGWDLQEFFGTGEREVALLMGDLARYRLACSFDRVLDFGCGVGRVTQAFGRRSRAVLGVEISGRMIRLARALNAHPTEVRYEATDASGLATVAGGEFSFIYSNIVLQHLVPRPRRPARMTAETS